MRSCLSAGMRKAKDSARCAALSAILALSPAAEAQEATPAETANGETVSETVEPMAFPPSRFLEHDVILLIKEIFIDNTPREENGAAAKWLENLHDDERLKAGYLVFNGEASVFLYVSYADSLSATPVGRQDWLKIRGNRQERGYQKCIDADSPCVSASSLKLPDMELYLRTGRLPHYNPFLGDSQIHWNNGKIQTLALERIAEDSSLLPHKQFEWYDHYRSYESAVYFAEDGLYAMRGNEVRRLDISEYLPDSSLLQTQNKKRCYLLRFLHVYTPENKDVNVMMLRSNCGELK